ncbi:MAG: glycosyltransferase family 2 protein [Melioribacteraceae bacterium]|nr:glycosyltransferase family 2 protein [Melioribacteraceae bacterium]
MSELLIVIFYLSLILLINSFFLYPIIIHLLFGRKSIIKIKERKNPTVTFIIAAYNEEKVIAKRIENIASLDYDFNNLEVLIGSDNSDDRTNEILISYQEKYNWLKIFLFKERKGKAGIINELVQHAQNELIVFTDANTEFQKDALKELVKDFADENVGGVCGKLILIESQKTLNESNEESKYWFYENIIKRAEGEAGISFSANGGIFAIRKKLFEKIPVDKPVTDDLFISLSVVDKGYKFNFSENAIAYEEVGQEVKDEFNRKVRFSATNFQTLIHFKHLLIGKNKLLAYAFFSHKVTRWILPTILFLLFLSSLILANQSLFIFLIFSFQLFFYFFALIGFIFAKLKYRFSLFSLPFYFVVSNIAVIFGFIKFLNKKHSVIWNSTKR